MLDMLLVENEKPVSSARHMNLVLLFHDLETKYALQTAKRNQLLNIDLSRVIHGDVIGDMDKLCQIFKDLIENAIACASEGSQISMRAYEKYSSIPGMAYYEFIFPVEGACVVSDLSYKLAENMKGQINCKEISEKERIFTVCIHLKIDETENIPSYATGKSTGVTRSGIQAGRYSGKRILLAEDNEMNMEIMEGILKIYGIDVETAEDGKIAVDMLLGKPQGYYDLIFMDVKMPNMDGYEATVYIRQEEEQRGLCPIPIIAMTASAFLGDVQRARETGMNDHISKPIDMKRLQSCLDQWLA